MPSYAFEKSGLGPEAGPIRACRSGNGTRQPFPGGPFSAGTARHLTRPHLGQPGPQFPHQLKRALRTPAVQTVHQGASDSHRVRRRADRPRIPGRRHPEPNRHGTRRCHTNHPRLPRQLVTQLTAGAGASGARPSVRRLGWRRRLHLRPPGPAPSQCAASAPRSDRPAQQPWPLCRSASKRPGFTLVYFALSRIAPFRSPPDNLDFIVFTNLPTPLHQYQFSVRYPFLAIRRH